MKEVDWEQKLHAHKPGCDETEVYTAESLDLERICAALPPAGLGGLVNAADVSTGFVRDALLDLSLVLKPNAQEDERSRDPTIWASDANWQELAVVLVMMGVAKAGNDRNTSTQRLIMNI